MSTGAPSCAEKFARRPRAPGPMLPYSPYVVSFVFGLLSSSSVSFPEAR